MADRELIAAIILAGLLVRHPTSSPDNLARDAADAADKLIKALDTSSSLPGPIGFTGQDDDEAPPGTP
jgi:hypothetical protein